MLLVAPHGGRRAKASALDLDDPRKVNDLHTAEITLELAERLGAPAIVNAAEDRNRLDLNRVSDVRERAPWLLDLLLEGMRRQIAESGEAVILFLHGWNAIQPYCDVGIGARLVAGALVPVRQGVPTIPPRFLPRLARFAEACRAGGIEVTIGDRYPAAGRHNLMQIFTSRFADDRDPRIAELASLGAGGRIAAVQLELAVPLRWPGPLRARFLRAVDAFAERVEVDGPLPRRWVTAHGESRSDPDSLAVEFHDGTAGIGGFAATERLSSGRRQGRFLVCIGAHRLGLFTGEHSAPGEERGETLRCCGLEWTRAGSEELRLRFDGPCLTFPRTDPFLDLETGLAEAELSHLEATLVWRPRAAGARLGHVEGEILCDGPRVAISAPAALRLGAPSEPRPWRERAALNVPLGSETFLSVVSRRAGEDQVEGEIVHAGRVDPLLSGLVSVRNRADGLLPETWRIEVASRSGALRVLGQVTYAVPVVRPIPDGKLFTVFGLARFTADGRVGFGTFEQSRRIPGRKGARR
ncbi:MAG: hypothetical protein ABW298_14990 [Candidatus Binatia bacterium]